jgi:two-component system response regulator VicR
MPFKVLIVDDKIDNESNEISKLPEMLRAAGYEVRTTSDGDQAYDLVWEYHPDLILLDIVFENQSVDGTEICEAIRLNGSDVPIILVTAIMKETEQVLRGFRAGADDYVTRPRDNREIMARIRANLPPEVIVVDDYLLYPRPR